MARSRHQFTFGQIAHVIYCCALLSCCLPPNLDLPPGAAIIFAASACILLSLWLLRIRLYRSPVKVEFFGAIIWLGFHDRDSRGSATEGQGRWHLHDSSSRSAI